MPVVPRPPFESYKQMNMTTKNMYNTLGKEKVPIKRYAQQNKEK